MHTRNSFSYTATLLIIVAVFGVAALLITGNVFGFVAGLGIGLLAGKLATTRA